ncbi:MAG: hypothetical protein EA381_14495 [Planctomycetaceae bacterium]|nr:MAG: hypothetical protein EA381_14495 [Planctomycetaceae bacterium]
MIHYTCDRCRQLIDPTEQCRYAVRFQIQCIADTKTDQGREPDLDPLSELHQTLEGLDAQSLLDDEIDEVDTVTEITEHLLEYDLCPRCYQKFARNPLGRDLQPVSHFSNN